MKWTCPLCVLLLLAPGAAGAELWPCAQRADADGDGKPDRVVLDAKRAGIAFGDTVVELPLAAPAVRWICLADLTGDGKNEVLAGAVVAASKDRRLRLRLFVYRVLPNWAEPLFLGTEGGGSLLGFGAADLDGDGRAEIIARERGDEGEQTRVYAWQGYGLREKADLNAKAPAWAPAPLALSDLVLPESVERSPVLPGLPLTFDRTPGKIRPVRVEASLAPAVNRRKYAWLPKSARRHLARHGFVVLRPKNPPAEFHSLYLDNQYRGLPSYVSADAALHLTHLLFDHALQESEKSLLAPALMRLVDETHAVARAVTKKGKTSDADLERVLLRLEVARLLLSGESGAIDGQRSAQVIALVAAIEKTQPAESDPFGLDMSDFVVRGHYTADPLLARYFRAYLFLSLAAAKSPREAALLASCALARPEARRLLALFEGHTRFLVGPLGGRTPLDMLPDLRLALGETPTWEGLVSKLNWIKNLDEGPVSLLPRGWPRDNDLLLQGVDVDRRSFPDPLDLLYALGSDRAGVLLAPAFKTWAQLRGRLDKARSAFHASRGADISSLAGRWLAALRWVLMPYPKGYASHQRSSAWADHNLVTAAAAWAELRRDVILYVKPPIVWAEGGDEDELPPGKAGFVEPVPELYEELAEVLAAFSGRLASLGLQASNRSSGRARKSGPRAILSEGEQLLRFLAACARKQLAGRGLTRDEHERLSSIGSEFEQILAGRGDLRLDPVPVIADVYYFGQPDTRTKQPLLVATGPVDSLVVAVPLGRRVILARGAVASFWHFVGERALSDEAWREMLSTKKAPAQPTWAKPIRVRGPRKARR